MMKKSWATPAQARRAQRLAADLLGGGEEWGCSAMPWAVRGGVRADRWPVYIFAKSRITFKHREAMRAFAGSEHIDVIAAEYGSNASDSMRLHLALRRGSNTLKLHDYRLFRLQTAPYPAFVPDVGQGPSVILKRGRLIVSSYRPWRDDVERQRGFIEGAALVRATIWND